MDGIERGGGGLRGPHRRRHGHRLFDYGDLRLLLLALIADKPSHGYELIKDIEERFGGGYSPSPGVIYPTLAWLDDMGYVTIEAASGGRKQYSITTQGQVFLTANQAAIDDIKARGAEPPGSRSEHRGQRHGRRFGGAPDPVVRAMENLRRALRMRLGREPLDDSAAQAMAAALESATQAVERS